MVDGLEIVLLKYLQRSGAAAPRSAMDQVGFGLVEGVDALLEVGAIEINIRCAGNVERFEFFWCADVEDDEVSLRQQFLSAPGVDVLDRRRRGSIGGNGG